MQPIRLVADDSGPDTPITIVDRANGNPVNLANVSSIQLKVRPVGSLVTSFTIAPTVDSAPNGTILIDWGSSLTGLAPGAYEGELQFTLTGPKIVTLWELLQITVRADFA